MYTPGLKTCLSLNKCNLNKPILSQAEANGNEQIETRTADKRSNKLHGTSCTCFNCLLKFVCDMLMQLLMYGNKQKQKHVIQLNSTDGYTIQPLPVKLFLRLGASVVTNFHSAYVTRLE